MAIKAYSLGFVFDYHRQNVVLIEKLKPAWQFEKLNGVGGKVEPGEESLACIVREFKEEAGVYIPPYDWSLFAIMSGIDWQKHPDGSEGAIVYCYETASDAPYHLASTQETEKIVKVPIVSVCPRPSVPVIPNIPVLIPLAMQGEFSRPANLEWTQKVVEDARPVETPYLGHRGVTGPLSTTRSTKAQITETTDGNE